MSLHQKCVLVIFSIVEFTWLIHCFISIPFLGYDVVKTETEPAMASVRTSANELKTVGLIDVSINLHKPSVPWTDYNSMWIFDQLQFTSAPVAIAIEDTMMLTVTLQHRFSWCSLVVTSRYINHDSIRESSLVRIVADRSDRYSSNEVGQLSCFAFFAYVEWNRPIRRDWWTAVRRFMIS